MKQQAQPVWHAGRLQRWPPTCLLNKAICVGNGPDVACSSHDFVNHRVPLGVVGAGADDDSKVPRRRGDSNANEAADAVDEVSCGGARLGSQRIFGPWG